MVLPKPEITKYPPISHKLKAQILKKIPAKYYKPRTNRINPRDARFWQRNISVRAGKMDWWAGFFGVTKNVILG